jgi:hypothetical protein
MWKQLAETLWRTLRLAEETERNRQNIKELEKEYRDYAAATEKRIDGLVVANERLSAEVQRLSDELKRQREHEESERRILKLELENYLLRQERGLPPVKPQSLPEPEVGDQKEDTEKVNEE